MMVVCLEVECVIYGAQSLKQKRSTIKSILDRTRRQFNVSISEVDYQEVWQRTKIAAVIVTNTYEYGEKVLQQVLKLIDGYEALDVTIIDMYRL